MKWTIQQRLSISISKLQQYLSGWWIPPPPIEWDDYKISPPGELFVESQTKNEIQIKIINLSPVPQRYIKNTITDVKQVKSIERSALQLPYADYYESA